MALPARTSCARTSQAAVPDSAVPAGTVTERPKATNSHEMARALLMSPLMPQGGMALRNRRAMMNEATQKKVLARLRKIAGQGEGIARMVEEDRYCVDVLLQIVSAQAALGETGKLVLRSHLETCVTAVLADGKPIERKQKLDELMQVFSRFGCMGAR